MATGSVHSTLVGVYKIKKKVKFMSVGVKLWQPVIILGLGKSQLGSTSIGQSSETDKVLERKPGKGAVENSDWNLLFFNIYIQENPP